MREHFIKKNFFNPFKSKLFCVTCKRVSASAVRGGADLSAVLTIAPQPSARIAGPDEAGQEGGAFCPADSRLPEPPRGAGPTPPGGQHCSRLRATAAAQS
ncbi:UNVERIFIED_CONTAM: hypothetical protein K2H54_060267 [Gekko kuhli]